MCQHSHIHLHLGMLTLTMWIRAHTLVHALTHTYTSFTDDATKLQQHLDLLREEYVKLQQKYSNLEQKHTRAIATSGNVGPDHFISKLIKLVSDLYDKSLYRYDELIMY